MNVQKRINRVTIHYQLDVKITDDANRNNDYTTLINRTIEFCNFFKNPMAEPFEWFLYRELLLNNANRIVKSCPIEPV